MNTRFGLAMVLLGNAMIAGASPGTASAPLSVETDFVRPYSFSNAQLTTDLTPSPDPSVVDVAIFYDQVLAERGSSLTSLELTTQRMIDYTNASYAASGIPLTLRIVWAGEFSERLEGLDTRAAHSLLGNTVRPQINTLLADFGIDAAVLIRATDDADDLFGVAILGTEVLLSDRASVPYALVCLGDAPSSGLSCFGNGGIFAHEVAHMFGAGHQRNAPVGGTGGAFEFSYASECGGGTIVHSPVSAQQEFYSTPNLMAGNEVCGISASEGPDGVDNTHTIDLLRSLMANLRDTMPIDGTVMIEGPASYAVTEGNAPLSITVRRAGDLSGPARASLAILSAPGHRADITLNPQELSFAPGQDAIVVQLSIVDDSTVELTEAVDIGLRNPWRLEDIGTPIQVTITDNDQQAPPAPAPPPSSGSGSVGLLSLLFLLLASMCRFGIRKAL